MFDSTTKKEFVFIKTKEKAKELLDIPDEYETVAMFVIGYQGEADQLPADLRERELKERVRKPLDEILSRGSFLF